MGADTRPGIVVSIATATSQHDQVSISKILDQLGLSPPETTKPLPAVHEVVRVPVDEEGRAIEGS